jgi:hypothetical protein
MLNPSLLAICIYVNATDTCDYGLICSNELYISLYTDADIFYCSATIIGLDVSHLQ